MDPTNLLDISLVCQIGLHKQSIIKYSLYCVFDLQIRKLDSVYGSEAKFAKEEFFS